MGCDCSPNQFNPENRFIGDIEDGIAYPLGCYTKEESDERYASKQTEADLAALEKRVAALEYKQISIDYFTASPSLCEIGSSNTINLIWSLNKAPTEQSINDVPVTGTSKQYTGVSADITYTLTVADNQSSVSDSVSVSFANRIYYGAASDLTSVTALANVLSNDPERTITVDAGANEYIVYAIPARLGNVTFFVDGFEGGFEPPVSITLTNRSGYSEIYKVYRSTNLNLGETEIEVREE